MGFIGTTTLLNYDVSINNSSQMTWSKKIDDISSYLESDGFEGINPTKKVCEHFKDKIGYCLPSSQFFVIDNGRLEIFNQPLNCLEFYNYDDLIEYLGDERKRIYVSKITLNSGRIYKAFIYEIDNLPNIRDNKLEVGFKGEDLCFLENTLFGAKMGDVVDIPINQLIIKYKQ